jgi:uncharacterized protein YciI
VHALVLLAPGAQASAGEEVGAGHVRFVEDLIEQKKIVLGGDWEPPIGGFEAAYLLSCASLDEAREIAASDPLVHSGGMQFEVVEWQLVDFDPEAVDRGSLLDPS